MTTKADVIQKDQQYSVPVAARPDFVLERGEGVTLYDTDGKAYTDWVAGIAVNALGYGDEELNDVVNQQLNTGLIHAFIKAQSAAGVPLPTQGTVCISVNDFDKGAVSKIARELSNLGFTIIATKGTAEWLNSLGIETAKVNKLSEGSPHIVDLMLDGKIDLMINTPLGSQAHSEGMEIRSQAYALGVPIITTMSAAVASVQGIKRIHQKPLSVRSLQMHHA